MLSLLPKFFALVSFEEQDLKMYRTGSLTYVEILVLPLNPSMTLDTLFNLCF